MKTADLDLAFDEGESVLEHFDLERARRPNLEARRVNVDLPKWMVEALDARAVHLGITRQSLIKMWIGSVAQIR
jgi:hypothetical protein